MKKLPDISDFSLLIKNLDISDIVFWETRLQKYFLEMDLGDNINYGIKNISFCFDTRKEIKLSK